MSDLDVRVVAKMLQRSDDAREKGPSRNCEEVGRDELSWLVPIMSDGVPLPIPPGVESVKAPYSWKLEGEG
jgi:hypothetical protein